MTNQPDFPDIPTDDETKATEARLKRQGILHKIINKNQRITIRPDNVYANVESFHEKYPFFYDKQQLFWVWDEETHRYVLTDEVELITFLESCFSTQGSSLNAKLRGEYLWAFKLIGRRNIPVDAPKTWIQFGDVVYDYKTKRSRPVDPSYFMCNPIPWKIGNTDETPTMDKLFKEWVGEEYIQTLYELLAYCCVTDYPIHSIFCFIGSGRNGKSKMQQLLKKFIGEHNICSTDLDQLVESRFESAKLYKKTLCLMGETDFGIMQHTGRLKRLTGQDLIGYEFKGKMPFDGENYAKLVISTNSLPTSKDTSDGFYRRWIILDFPNEFSEGKDILAEVPDVEYQALANKVVGIIPTLLDRGTFTNQGSITQRKERYELASNPLPIFLKLSCEVGNPDDFVHVSDFISKYYNYLLKIKRRLVSKKEIDQMLEIEGIYKEKLSYVDKTGDRNFRYCYLGIGWKDTQMCQKSHVSHSDSSVEGLSEEVGTFGNSGAVDLSLTDQILAQIPEKGVEIEHLVQMFKILGIEITKMIQDLKEKGEIYEPSPGKLKKL